MNKVSLSIIFNVVFTLVCFSQNRLTGLVLDEKGVKLPDVSVSFTKDKRTVKTDADGGFVLQISDSSGTIHLSMVGYVDLRVSFFPKELKEGMILQMEKQEEYLEEVEVFSTGYQQLPKERSTGAFSHISEKVLNEQVSTDILSRLEAVANGVNINRTLTGSPGLTIRGLSSIQGEKSPLIVVDNFPYEGDLQNINPNDVANITLLKDAAAASIWGARAGNGVIVITTKSGALNQPLRISANANLTVSSKPDLHYLPVLSATDYIEVEKFLFSNKHNFSDTLSRQHAPFTPLYELLFAQQKGLISQAEAEQTIGEWAKIDLRDEYLNMMYRPAFKQQYALNLNGGAQRATWYFSTGYDRNVDELYATYERFNLNFQHTYRPIQGLQLSSGIRYTNSNSRNGRTEYGSIRMNNGELPPYTAFRDGNGALLPITRSYRQSYIDTVGGGQLLDWNYYMDDYLHLKNSNSLNDVLLNFGARYEATDWLNFDAKYQFEKQQSNLDMLYGQNSHFSRNLVNQYTQLRPDQTPLHIISPGGIYDPSMNQLISHSLRGQVNVAHEMGKHHIVGLLGVETRSISSDSRTNRFYGYSPEVGTFSNVDLTTTYPSIVTGSRSFIPDNTGFSNRENRFLSVFANAAYTYSRRYILSFSARRDASNLFGVNTNDKWNMLWSLGGAWNISQEEFYTMDWLPYAKLRVTHGVSGNVDLGRSAVTTINYVSAANPHTKHKIARFNQFGDPELRWERVGMTNLAFDFAGKDNRLSGSIDFFFKRATDLFGPAEIDYTTGTSITLTKNVAAMKGRGADIMLNSINLKNDKWSWSTNLNLSWYKDEVEDYFRSDVNGRFYVTNERPAITGVIGKPLYAMYSYQWKGLDGETGAPVGYINGHHSQNYNAIVGDSTLIADLVYSGPAIPVVYGSMGNTFSWKNISLSFRIQYNFGYYYRRNSLDYYGLFASGRGHAEYAQRWQKPGDELTTTVPAMVYPVNSNRSTFYGGAEINAERGDHIRLQYVNLVYDLFSTKGEKSRIFREASIYVNVANLGILWAANKEGLDPEYRSSPPPSRTISVGTRLNF